MMDGNQEDDGDGVEKLTFGRRVHKQVINDKWDRTGCDNSYYDHYEIL